MVWRSVADGMVDAMAHAIAMVRLARAVLSVLWPKHGTDQLTVGELFRLRGCGFRFDDIFHNPPLENATLLGGMDWLTLEDCGFRSKNFAVKVSQGWCSGNPRIAAFGVFQRVTEQPFPASLGRVLARLRVSLLADLRERAALQRRVRR